MARSNTPSLRLLVVDDEPEIRELLTEYLTARGHTVEVALDGRGALERLRTHPFDVVLTDVRMPVMEGGALVSAIQEENLSVGVVVMTGFPTIQTATQALKMGASDYVLKPFRLRDIHDSIVRAAGRSRLEQDLARAEACLALYEAAHRVPLAPPDEALDSLWVALGLAACTEARATAFACWQPAPGQTPADWTLVASRTPTAALLHLDPSTIEVARLDGRLAVVPVLVNLERVVVFAVDGGDVRSTAQLEQLELLARPLAYALAQHSQR